jgi:hypothetical protein
MFEVIQNGTNRLDLEMSGKLEDEEIKIAIDELIRKSKNIENGKMLYDVIDFRLPSPSALAIQFSVLPSVFRILKKFDRTAILTDKTWLKKLSELEGLLYPGLKIKAFNRDQRVEAEAWLNS